MQVFFNLVNGSDSIPDEEGERQRILKKRVLKRSLQSKSREQMIRLPSKNGKGGG